MKQTLLAVLAVISFSAQADATIRLNQAQHEAALLWKINVKVNGVDTPEQCAVNIWTGAAGKCDINVPAGQNTVEVSWKDQTFVFTAPLQDGKRYNFVVGSLATQAVVGAQAIDFEIPGQLITTNDDVRAVAVLTSVK